ncbi:MAG: 2-hydroxyglutaryl-CoA dehydratase [Planctomycetes bacterium]|nr:2-hydroxyglutaryl-CoA dehydratase [Planctomycetota bacterium]
MFVLGIDLGSRACHAVLADGEGRIAERSFLPAAADLHATARRALESFGLRRDEIQYVAATGFGRGQVRFRDLAITEITCHARAARALLPDASCVLDIGARNARAIRTCADGRTLGFRVGDRCAAGGGRLLERAARALDLPLDEIGPVSLRAQDPVAVSSVCAVLAESEIVRHVTDGRAVEDILMGLHLSVASRAAALVRQLGADGDVALTGGVARNAGMVAALERKLGLPVRTSPDSEYAGAIGAALLALKRLRILDHDPRVRLS